MTSKEQRAADALTSMKCHHCASAVRIQYSDTVHGGVIVQSYVCDKWGHKVTIEHRRTGTFVARERLAGNAAWVKKARKPIKHAAIVDGVHAGVPVDELAQRHAMHRDSIRRIVRKATQ